MSPLVKICRLLAPVFLTVAVVFLHAQSAPSLVDFSPRFELFRLPGSNEGNNVQSIVQDSLGFVWFASSGGLRRYDGQHIVTYRHDPLDSTSIASDYVEWICIDKKGTPETRLQFVVLPHWSRTWWACLLYVALIFSSIFFGYRFLLNRQMEHTESLRLKDLDVVKTKLYTDIAHEFRTPLTVILGMARQALENPKDYFQQGLDMIIRNSQNLLELVNQMLDLSKLESGKLSLHYEQADVVNFVKYLVESFHALAESKDIKIHFLTDLEKFTMSFDAERLQQIVSNLLSNALKFTPPGGNVYVDFRCPLFNTGLQKPSIQQQKNKIEIRVKDTGIGISEEHLPHVFDCFFQEDGTRNRHTDGTGIGLSLTKELVKLMEGEILVKSVPGKGTEFTVTLPVQQPGGSHTAETGFVNLKNLQNIAPTKAKVPENTFAFPAKHSPFSNDDSHGEKPLLLLAEDNADVIGYLVSCLNSDYRLAIAKDGQEAVKTALEIIPDLVITDVMMPHTDGYEACRILKNDERTSHIPIIMLTAKVDLDSKLEGLKSGADAYLIKPFHKKELLLRIEKLLELRQRLQLHYRPVAGLSEGLTIRKEIQKTGEMEDVFVEKVRQVVENHLCNYDFTVENLCHEMGISHAQLHRKLSALTGFSGNKFIRYVRLLKALELLRDPGLSITAVAFDSGFSDLSYFGKVFKQEFGVTPMEWREQHRNDG